jgi:phosphate transport system substrate-binding protein
MEEGHLILPLKGIYCKKLSEGNMASKSFRRFLYLFALTLLFTGCGAQDTTGTQSTGQQHILIEGSNALRPFISAIAPIFERQYIQLTAKVKGGGNDIESANIQIQGGGSITGLEAMGQQKADITMTDIYANPATFSSPNLSDQIVVVIPYTLIVNSSLAAAIHSLTSQQVTDIFSTHVIQNWSQLGGPDLPVVPISEGDNIETHGNTDFFQTTVLNDNPEVGTPVDEDSGESTLDVVAGTPGAIGYIPVPLVTGKNVQPIAIDGSMATADNIESNHYHFWVYGHLYTVKGNEGSISSFLHFAVSSNAQQIAQKLGYVPLAGMKLLR